MTTPNQLAALNLALTVINAVNTASPDHWALALAASLVALVLAYALVPESRRLPPQNRKA